MAIDTTHVEASSNGPKTVLVVGAGQRGQVSDRQRHESYAEPAPIDLFHIRFATSRLGEDSRGCRLEPVPTKGDREGSQVGRRHVR